MGSLTSMVFGMISVLLVTGCKTELAMPSGGAAEISQSSSTLNPLANPAGSAHILSGKEAYDSSGNKVTGALTTSVANASEITGNQDNDAVTQISVTPGVNELFSSVLVNLGAHFQKENICAGKTIFGRAGTAACNALFGDTIYSMAPRSDLATAPTSSSNRSIATIAEEAGSESAFTSNYDLVPKPEYVTDGRYGNGINDEKRHYLETIVGRPTVTCGEAGTIEARISDCAIKNTNEAFYSGKNYGQSGEGDWKLVTRTNNSYEVWRDERTKLLWSDTLSQVYNWCQAAGYSSSSSTTSKTGYECQAGEVGSLQPATPMSACADASLLSNLNGVITYETPGAENERKGNLSVSDVKWRLPTIEDWQLANVNGIRKVLPNMDTWFWSASSISGNVYGAWVFYGGSGYVGNDDRNIDYSVRCVGR